MILDSDIMKDLGADELDAVELAIALASAFHRETLNNHFQSIVLLTFN